MTRKDDRDRLHQIYAESGQRFTDHYLAYAQGYAHDFEALAGEMDNIFAAIGLCGDLRAWAKVVQIVESIDDFLDEGGYWEELVAAYHVAIESAENHFLGLGRNPEPAAWHDRITMRLRLTSLLVRRGEYMSARRLAEEALRQARRIQHEWLQERCLAMLCGIAQLQGRQKDLRRFQAALRALTGGNGGSGMVLGEHDGANSQPSASDQSGQSWQSKLDALTSLRQGGSPEQVAQALGELGNLAVERQQVVEAKRLYEEGLVIWRSLDQAREIAGTLDRLANLAKAQGALDAACDMWLERLEIERTNHRPEGILETLQALGDLAVDQGTYARGLECYEEAIQLATRLGNRTVRCFCLNGAATIWRASGRLDVAQQCYEQSLAAARASGHPGLISVILFSLGKLAREQGDVANARRYLKERLQLEKRAQHQAEAAWALHELGNVAYVDGDHRTARREYNAAMESFRRVGDALGVAYCQGSLAVLACDAGEYAAGWELLQNAISIGRQHMDHDLLATAAKQARAFLEVPEFNERATTLLASLESALTSS